MCTKQSLENEHSIRLWILIEDAVPGVLHSLQDSKSVPVTAQRAVVRERLAFEFEVRAKVSNDSARRLGDHIRREGHERRFVYIAIGTLAGDAASLWSRRMKIDVLTIGAELVAAAARGGVLGVAVARRCGRRERGGQSDGTGKPSSS